MEVKRLLVWQIPPKNVTAQGLSKVFRSAKRTELATQNVTVEMQMVPMEPLQLPMELTEPLQLLMERMVPMELTERMVPMELMGQQTEPMEPLQLLTEPTVPLQLLMVPMELTELMVPMELTEPMEPMEPTEMGIAAKLKAAATVIAHIIATNAANALMIVSQTATWMKNATSPPTTGPVQTEILPVLWKHVTNPMIRANALLMLDFLIIAAQRTAVNRANPVSSFAPRRAHLTWTLHALNFLPVHLLQAAPSLKRHALLALMRRYALNAHFARPVRRCITMRKKRPLKRHQVPLLQEILC
jgi:hypothetical protein